MVEQQSFFESPGAQPPNHIDPVAAAQIAAAGARRTYPTRRVSEAAIEQGWGTTVGTSEADTPVPTPAEPEAESNASGIVASPIKDSRGRRIGKKFTRSDGEEASVYMNEVDERGYSRHEMGILTELGTRPPRGSEPSK